MMDQLHQFPPATTQFQFLRLMLAGYVPILMLVTPLLLPRGTSGVGLGMAVGCSLVGWLLSWRWIVLRFWCVGLLQEAPPHLVQRVKRQSPNARVAALSWKMANALALHAERTVLITTGALHVLSEAEQQTLLDHELGHLAEPSAAQWRRRLPMTVNCSGLWSHPDRPWCCDVDRDRIGHMIGQSPAICRQIASN